jgi:hypothetical protein
MARRVAVALLVALLVAGSASAGGIHDRKRAVDARISQLHGKIASAQHREAVLGSLIAVKTANIRSLAGDVAAAQARLAGLEHELAVDGCAQRRPGDADRQLVRFGVLAPPERRLREHRGAVELAHQANRRRRALDRRGRPWPSRR